MPFRDEEGGGLSRPNVDDGEATIACPSCSGRIDEEAQCCRHCGHWLSAEASNRRPLWITVGIFLCLMLALYWAIWG